MAETWVIKSDAAGEFATTQISFTSNGQKFTSIGANAVDTFIVLRYDNNEVAGYDPGAGSYGYEFDNEAYRKLTFDTPPTGALLTWLQANGVKQPDDTAVQDTKAVTITSNGTVSVTPDAPYDGLSSVDVTVNVASGGGSVETCTVTFSSNTHSDYEFAYMAIYLTVFENNETTTKTVSYLNNITVSNVVLNSFGFVIYTSRPNSISTNNATKIKTSTTLDCGFTFTGNASIYSTMPSGGGGGA